MPMTVPFDDAMTPLRCAAALGLSGVARSTLGADAGRSARTSTRWLVLAQTFEGCLTHVAAHRSSPRTRFRRRASARPMPRPASLRGAFSPLKGFLPVRKALSWRKKRLGIARIEACADPADVDEPSAVVDAGDQRADIVRPAAPPADDDLMAGAALDLLPGIRAAGGVGCVQALGDDAFEVELARGLPGPARRRRRDAPRSGSSG